MSDLSLEQANTIIARALAHADSAGYRPMAVVVLDTHGGLKAGQRQDGATAFRIDIATGKAWAAVQMGASSRVLWQRASENPVFFSALAATGQGKFIPQTGAVLIKDAQGRTLGAVGASGGTGEQDEEICAAGIRAAGLVVG
jgi:uncharacterized protein GlcG (DUF336 family)